MNSLVRRISWLRNRVLFLSDLILILGCAFVAFAARYEGPWTLELTNTFRAFVVASLPLKIILLLVLGLYRRLWRYASVSDLEVLGAAAVACAVVDGVVGVLFIPLLGLMPDRISYAVLLLDACLCALAIALPRLTIRVLARRDRRARRTDARRAIVIGAGVAGGMIVRELVENAQLGIMPVALLDDDPQDRKSVV